MDNPVKLTEKQIEDQKRLELAQNIAAISDSMAKLLKSGLNRKAIIILLNNTSKVGMRDIEYVLNSLEALKADYTTLK